MTAPDLRPLAIGELIDRSAVFWRQHLGALFKLYLGFQLVLYAFSKSYALAMARWFPLIRGGPQLLDALKNRPMVVAEQYAIAIGAGLVLAAVTLWVSWILVVAASYFVIRRRLGEPVTVQQSLARARARLGTVTGALVLATLWGVGVFLLSLVPGGLLMGAGAAATALHSPALAIVGVTVGSLVMVLGLILALLWYVLRFLLTGQVIAMEDVGAVEALKRSGALISGKVGAGFMNRVKVRATVLLTIAVVILFVVGLVAGMPAIIIQFVYVNPLDPAHANPDAVPQLLLVPAELLQVFAQAVFSPLYLVFGALFYLDMRVRREGLDLELKLNASSNPAE